MRILLDTNIFIPLEDSAIDLDKSLAELNRLASGKHQLLIHPATSDDILRDKNEERRIRTLARLAKYTTLESPPELDTETEKALFGSPRKANDSVDNLILYALHKDCVHWLVTQDEGVHKKAKRLGDEERVLDVDQAIRILAEESNEQVYLYPNIQDVPCHSLSLKDEFFDSLRLGYPGFDGWYKNQCAKTGRHAWAWIEDDKIQAVCIYKTENDPIVNLANQGLLGKVLKLCTFKVQKQGYKIGELLLKQAFNHAIENGYRHVYVAVEPIKHELLEDLLRDYGFYRYGTDPNRRDVIYVKDFPKMPPQADLDPLEYAVRYYPFIKVKDDAVFLVPIQPQYHKILFPELEPQQDLFVVDANPAGHAIKQAYLCKSPTRSIEAGDVLFFYRTGDDRAITTYGVVDQFHIENDAEKIFQWVSKRTVYSLEEIQEMAGGEVKVILFRFVRHLETKLSYARLRSTGIVNGPIQSITKLDRKRAGLLINEAGIDGRTLLD